MVWGCFPANVLDCARGCVHVYMCMYACVLWVCECWCVCVCAYARARECMYVCACGKIHEVMRNKAGTWCSVVQLIWAAVAGAC